MSIVVLPRDTLLRGDILAPGMVMCLGACGVIAYQSVNPAAVACAHRDTCRHPTAFRTAEPPIRPETPGRLPATPPPPSNGSRVGR